MAGATVAVRPRNDADLPLCEAMLLAVHDADGYPVNMPAEPVTFLDLPGLLGAWVAVSPASDPGLVGHVVLRPRTVEPVMALAAAATGLGAEQLAVVARLLVVPWARGLGAGRALLDVAVARAHELGRRPVLDVVKGSEPAIGLYERAGWQRCGEARVTYGTRAFDEYVYLGPDRPRSHAPED